VEGVGKDRASDITVDAVKMKKPLLIPSALPTFIGPALFLFFQYSEILKAVGVGLVCSIMVGLILFLEALLSASFLQSPGHHNCPINNSSNHRHNYYRGCLLASGSWPTRYKYSA